MSGFSPCRASMSDTELDVSSIDDSIRDQGSDLISAFETGEEEEEASLSENDEQANIDASSDSDDGVQNISADSRATTPQPQRF